MAKEKNYKTVMNRTNILETTGGTIDITQRWPRKDRMKGPPDLPLNFQLSDRVERCLDSLNALQFTRTHYLTEGTLGVPLQFLHDSLPYMVQHDVNIFQPIAEDIWSIPFEPPPYDPDEPDPNEEYMEDIMDRYQPAFPYRRYHFWPIDINRVLDDDEPPHWGLIVLHLAHKQDEKDDPNEPNDPLVGPYNYLDSYTIINPNHGDNAREIEHDVDHRLQYILPGIGIECDVNAPQLTPDGEVEEWSSGIRIFEMIRIWLDRLTELYCQNPHGHDGARFWASHPGWINLDAVRSNMIGMAATMVNRAMDSTTRIAIEPILDNAMQCDGETVETETMLPNRQEMGVFVPSQSRRHPALLVDNPVDDDDSESNSESSSESSSDPSGGSGGNSSSGSSDGKNPPKKKQKLNSTAANNDADSDTSGSDDDDGDDDGDNDDDDDDDDYDGN
ncbi:hypothetical protein GGR58DRAFT_503939 [Xylaria digitata]|nr:hypothetical protein GGR58DRAFT_503939 [Xylaria digitata]